MLVIIVFFIACLPVWKMLEFPDGGVEVWVDEWNL